MTPVVTSPLVSARASRPRRAVCIGECMVELRPVGEDGLARGFAGDVYNTAVYLKRSSPELEVQFATCVGEDPLSQAMRAEWAAQGIGDALADTTPGRQPGLYLIETDAEGDRQFYYWRGESAARGWLRTLVARGALEALGGAELVYLSGISLAILTPEDRTAALELMRALKGQVGRLAFDPNYRPGLWPSVEAARAVLEAAMASADVVLPSYDDLERLYGAADPLEQVGRLAALGPAEIALTTGPGRCLVHDGAAREVLGERAQAVVDTSGAGDSFNGAYLAARLRGASPDDAAKAGLALAAEVVGQPGAISSKSMRTQGP